MPVTVDATVGGASANSYVTKAEADAYVLGRLNASTWEDETDTDKLNRALVSATRRLDQEEWQGRKVATTQALEWPRSGTSDQNGNAYATDAIPQPVKDATCELALAMLSEDLLADSGLEAFNSVTVGSLQVTPRHGRPAGDLPENVRRELRGLLATARNTIPLERG